jgi:hypothetical protein
VSYQYYLGFLGFVTKFLPKSSQILSIPGRIFTVAGLFFKIQGDGPLGLTNNEAVPLDTQATLSYIAFTKMRTLFPGRRFQWDMKEPGTSLRDTTANSLSDYWKTEDVLAMAQIIKKYGKYPLELNVPL